MNSYKMKRGLESYFEGTLVGGAIGDALGNPLEGMTKERILYKYGRVIDYQTLWEPAGTFTDDTELTLITAESLIDFKGLNLNDLARRFVNWIKIARSFGITTQSSIMNLVEGKSPNESGMDSASNGPAMRASPFGLLYFKNKIKLYDSLRKASFMTHANEQAFAGALAVALGIQFIIKNPKSDISTMFNYLTKELVKVDHELVDKLNFVRENLKRDVDFMIDNVGTSSYVIHSVPFAFYCFARKPNDFEDIVVTAANAGGDTDTNASIAGNLGGCYNGLDRIPKRLVNGLREFVKVKKIANKLYKLHIN